jgi:hypothetical protein
MGMLVKVDMKKLMDCLKLLENLKMINKFMMNMKKSVRKKMKI